MGGGGFEGRVLKSLKSLTDFIYFVCYLFCLGCLSTSESPKSSAFFCISFFFGLGLLGSSPLFGLLWGGGEWPKARKNNASRRN